MLQKAQKKKPLNMQPFFPQRHIYVDHCSNTLRQCSADLRYGWQQAGQLTLIPSWHTFALPLRKEAHNSGLHLILPLLSMVSVKCWTRPPMHFYWMLARERRQVLILFSSIQNISFSQNEIDCLDVSIWHAVMLRTEFSHTQRRVEIVKWSRKYLRTSVTPFLSNSKWLGHLYFFLVF